MSPAMAAVFLTNRFSLITSICLIQHLAGVSPLSNRTKTGERKSHPVQNQKIISCVEDTKA